MKSEHHARAEAAIYWAAVSLVVCEGLSIRKAAERLGVDGERLRKIIRERRLSRPLRPARCCAPEGLLQ